MKPIRIFAVPSHVAKERVSGVDFARIIQPMTHLSKHKDFKVTIYEPKLNEKMDWLEVTANNDILFLNYTTNPWSFAIMGCLARKHNRKIVLDLDDALWLCREDNTAYEVFKKGSEGIKNFTAICNEVDWITTTSSYLRNVVCNETMKRHEQVKILPNYIDLELYSHRSEPKNYSTVNILHFGSSSHYKDLQDSGFVDGLEKLMKDLPNVRFVTVGALIPKLKNKWGARYRHDFGDVDIYKWIKNKFPQFMDEADIVVAPLDIDTYNRAKSPIKRWEASSAMKPFVGQDIYPYQQAVNDGVDGFLCSSSDDWYKKLKMLSLDFELRKKIGKAGYKRTVKEAQIQNNIWRYAKFFKSVLTNK